jgi:uncharacterized protein (TIGR03382 family)
MGILGFVFALLPVEVALQCEVLQPLSLEVTAVASGPAPEKPLAVSVHVTRGTGPIPYGCGQYKSTDCMALGYVDLVVDLPEGAVGFALRPRGGELPDDLELPDGPVLGPNLTLTWPDGAVDEQEPVDFDLDVFAIDAAGQASRPIDVRVFDRGRELDADLPVNCAHVPPTLPLGLALLLLRRRR